MKKQIEPKVLFEHGDFRIVQFDDRNVEVQEYREGISLKTRKPTKGWRGIGYYHNLAQAMIHGLPTAVTRDMGYDEALKELESLLSSIEAAARRLAS